MTAKTVDDRDFYDLMQSYRWADRDRDKPAEAVAAYEAVKDWIRAHYAPSDETSVSDRLRAHGFPEASERNQEITRASFVQPAQADETPAAPSLRDALQALVDEQNGPPLERRREQWQRAYDHALHALRAAGEPSVCWYVEEMHRGSWKRSAVGHMFSLERDARAQCEKLRRHSGGRAYRVVSTAETPDAGQP